ncbi:MAG: hypothetical protein ACRC6V_14385 [Bacteroidales bacterium]
MKPIFILNAPAQTGKDTIAREILLRVGEAESCAMKDPMFKVFCATVGLSMYEFMELYETPGWKDTPQEITNGKTPRELMIHISENFVKPFFGEDYYGKALGEFIERFEETAGTKPWVIPDGGFQGEYDAFKAIHGDRVNLISFFREGYVSFGNDSRDWIFDWDKYPEGGAEAFDTTEGNEHVINFIVEMINAA